MAFQLTSTLSVSPGAVFPPLLPSSSFSAPESLPCSLSLRPCCSPSLSLSLSSAGERREGRVEARASAAILLVAELLRVAGGVGREGISGLRQQVSECGRKGVSSARSSPKVGRLISVLSLFL